MGYVPLHNHSIYGSFLDGLIKLNKLFKKLKEYNIKSIAITDHGTLCITSKLKQFEENDIKLIPGIEFYVTPNNSLKTKNHLVCLAINKRGYKNILKMNYLGYKNNMINLYDRYISRVSYDMFDEYMKDVVVLSACLAGIPQQHILHGELDKAIEHVNWMKKITFNKEFGESLYFLEIQPVDYYIYLNDNKTSSSDKKYIEKQCIQQKTVNDALIYIAEKTNTRLVVTTDSHYVNREDRELHIALLAMQSKKTIYDEIEKGRLWFESTPLLSREEIFSILTEKDSKYNNFPADLVNNMLDNTLWIDSIIEKPSYMFEKGYKMPIYNIKEEEDYENFLEWKKNIGL